MRGEEEMQESNGVFELLCHGPLNIIRISSLLPPPDFSTFISKVAFKFRVNIIILVLETTLHIMVKEEYCKIFTNLY